MARSRRIIFPGCIQHVMNRGIRKSDIFKDPDDYQVFMALMGEMRKRFGIRILAWCLMTNHFHILIASDTARIAEAMKYLEGTYAAYFNHKYGYKGHLFEDRYTAVTAPTTGYLLEVSRYIHLNPGKAGLVNNPLHYLYSSYRDYVPPEKPRELKAAKELKERQPCEWLKRKKMDSADLVTDTSVILAICMGPDPRKSYREFVEGKDIKHKFEEQVQSDICEDEKNGKPKGSRQKGRQEKLQGACKGVRYFSTSKK